jgi:mannosyltransferase
MRAWTRPGAAWLWMLYAAAVATLGLLHVVGLLLVAGHAWAVLAWRREAWWRFAIAATIGIAVSAPLLLSGMQQRHQVAYIPRVTFFTFASSAEVLFGGVVLALVVITLALFSLPLRYPAAVVATWAVAPPAALVLVSLVVPMFLPRYLLYTTPGWCLLVGAALARLRPVPIVVTVLAVAVIGLPVQAHLRTAGGHDQATAQLGQLLTEYVQPGDAVVYADDETVGAWTARDAVAHYVPAARRPKDILATHPPRHDGLLLATERSDVGPALDGTARVWVIRIGTLTDPLAGIGQAKQDALGPRYRVEQAWYPPGITLALLRESR